MQNAHVVDQIERVITRFRAWDAAVRRDEERESFALSVDDRTTLLGELNELRPHDGRLPFGVRDLLGSVRRLVLRVAMLREGRRCREEALLFAYETACERAPSFGVSQVLLRHYATIKLGSHAQPRLRAPRGPATAGVPGAATALQLGPPC